MNDPSGKNKMYKFMLDNTISNKCESINLNDQVAMNLIGNNIKYKDVKGDEKEFKGNGKTRGLLYHDFCSADNLLILLHGKIITCFDLMDKSKKPGHFMLPSANANDPYNFDNEPVCVWMMDKNVKETEQRYKVIVAFKNGNVMELTLKENNQH